MDFQLKQWRELQHESEREEQQPSAKQPRLLFSPNPHEQQQQIEHHQQQQNTSSALPLFVVPEPTISKLSNLSAYPPDSTVTATTKYPKMGSYFSLAQWQELELQALIFRHMLTGAPIPPELLHLVKKSLITSPYYLPHPLQQYPYYQQSLMQSGYWGRGAMDPEPGRCRRTDGKKWRCSRDVVAGQKYCERHMHRGRNRSRKPVEIPTSTNQSTGGAGSASGGGGGLKTSNPLAAAHQPLAAMSSSGGDGTHHFTFSGPSPSIDLLHLSQRPPERLITKKDPFETQNDASSDGKPSGRTLRHFFDDWPRSLHETGNAGNNVNSVTSSTSLSISTPGNAASDFSLKLSTGNRDDTYHHSENVEQDVNRSNWVAPWGTNQVPSVGGPLAEALRSSTSNSSPTSVLHQLTRGTTSETSYVST